MHISKFHPYLANGDLLSPNIYLESGPLYVFAPFCQVTLDMCLETVMILNTIYRQWVS